MGRLRGLAERRPGHETDFLPAALEIIERPASPAGRALAGTLAALTALAIVWACLGKVDIIATAPGKIMAVGDSKTIQPLETGVVAAIQVDDGDHVAAGQVLIELDATTATADRDKDALDLMKTRLEIARLTALRRFIAGQPAVLADPPADAPADEVEAARAAVRAQSVEQQAKLAGLDQQIQAKIAEQAEAEAGVAKLQASIPLTADQAELRRQLKEMQWGNKLAWLEQEQKLVEQQHDLPGMIQHRDQAAASIEALRRQREQTQAEFEKTVLTDLAAARQKAAEFGKEEDKAAQRLALLTLKAPIAGTVQQLAAHTVGGVVTPAQALMVVVPDDAGLVVEARIPNKDVGFIHAGQEAQIKVETFNFTRYGLIQGKVLDVSRDAVAERPDQAKPRDRDRDKADGENPDDQAGSAGYVAHVALGSTSMLTEGGPVELGPGMSVTAEIKTGQRRVISYLLSPIARYRQESFHER
jgi:hemolysin D